MSEQAASEILDDLQAQGYRVTGQRRAILDIVATSKGHFTANDVLEAVRQHLPSVGRATVFRTLELLARLGWLSRVHETAGCHGYVLCNNSHHHHLVCLRCGMVVNVANCDLTEQVRKLSQSTGFRIDGHRLEYFGLCGLCRRHET